MALILRWRKIGGHMSSVLIERTGQTDCPIGRASHRLRECLKHSRRGLCLTGAGLSTECGIPDFRSPGSPWLAHKPIDFQSFMASREIRTEAWRRKFEIDRHAAGAQPGRGHKALAQLVRDGTISCVITQNIDGLHQASGLSDDAVIELHGNGTYATCLSCACRYELSEVRRRFQRDGQAPDCDCGGPIKSATIAFGQAMPAAKLRRAQALTLECDLFLVVGSSLAVYPAASLPMMAKRNGAGLVILNGTATQLDVMADLVIHEDIGSVLEPFALNGAAAQHLVQ
jgi:NAD-dependent deacetylase